MGNKVYVKTGRLLSEGVEEIVPFEKATDEQLKTCDRLVFDRHGKLLNLVEMKSMAEIERQIEAKRNDVLRRFRE